MKLRLDEVRRLTGPNLLWSKPGAIVDVFVDEGDADQVAQCWQSWLLKLLPAFGWQSESSMYRVHEEGLNMAMSAPIDALYTACELAELAWDLCAAELSGDELPDWQTRVKELKLELQEELNPQLMELINRAEQAHVTALVDDDELSLGMGTSSRSWPISALPSIDQLNWAQYQDIPTAFITGTNGKSTSVRLADQIAKAAGLVSGVTSTDFIRVGDEIIDRGDYSGPGGARMLLRDPRTEIAFMEVARGGILRRGLPVSTVDAALITNVASDHLGQYGINTVEQLAAAKFVVAKALSHDKVLVVNADNALVVGEAQKLSNTLCWFSRDADNPLVKQQIDEGGLAVTVIDGQFVHFDGSTQTSFGKVDEARMTMQGTALHNIENALGVIGLCMALGLPETAIKQGLKAFGSTPEDNPGRGNAYQLPHCRVIVDFAHNQHSMSAIVEMVKQMPGNNRIAMFGHAGDRSDQDIDDLTRAAAALDAQHYVITELQEYLRGRELGELPQLMTESLHRCGVSDSQISVLGSPLEGVQKAVELAQQDDVLLLFVLDQREAVHEWLSAQAV